MRKETRIHNNKRCRQCGCEYTDLEIDGGKVARMSCNQCGTSTNLITGDGDQKTLVERVVVVWNAQFAE